MKIELNAIGLTDILQGISRKLHHTVNGISTCPVFFCILFMNIGHWAMMIVFNVLTPCAY